MKLHHAALCVSDIRQAVDWYVQNLNANIAYQDETWALLDIENTSIALVLPSQHPPHLAFETQDAKKYGKSVASLGCRPVQHRGRAQRGYIH
jgi:catechol 2,3-dioxygenase-like lactoylglutathione lyase family enzyme